MAKGNRTSQEERGKWKKDKSERGIIRIGKNWYVRVCYQGKPHVEVVGPSKALALKVYQKRKTEIAETRFFPGANVTVAELLNLAIEEVARNKDSNESLGKYTYRYDIMLELFKSHRGSSLKPEEIEKILSAHCKTPANFNRYRNSLSHAYQLGVKNGKINVNPARSVKLKKENNTIERCLEPEEETAIRLAIRKLCPLREAEFDLALYAGLRWSEQYRLSWSQVKLKQNEVLLKVTKSGEKQYARLNAGARSALEMLRAQSAKVQSITGVDRVCPDSGRKVFYTWWNKVLKESKVTNFRWHDLRHTFASRLAMNGVDIYSISRLMRHGDVRTTQRYAHLIESHLQQQVEKLVG